ncbi:MAG: DNA polymerase III subunit gamma/tau [Anaerolineae bacterium]
MSQALYRKWRPARFDDVIGQEHVTRTLRNSLAAGRVGHAYLFCGPRGTGKTTIARLLAKGVNCLHEYPAQRPCNNCAACIAINEGRFLDLIEIDAASNTGVDDIRDLRDKIHFSPGEGRQKVYIIDEVHMLSTAAFNALLKTLEEPPPHAMFVLATTEQHKVPLTIKSRCQQFNFRLLLIPEIVRRLEWLAAQENLTIEPEALAMIARHGAGSLRDAESLLDQLVAAPGDTITLARAQLVLGTATDTTVLALTEAWLNGDGRAGLAVIHDALASGADARQFSRQMVSYLRQLLLVQAAGPDVVLEDFVGKKDEMAAQAQRAPRLALIEAVKRFNEAAVTPAMSWQPQLPLELAFIESLPSEPAPPRPQRAEAAPSQTVSEPAAAEADKPELPAQEAQPELIPVEEEVEPTAKAGAEPVEKQAEKPAPEAAGPLTLERVTACWRDMVAAVGGKSKNLPALLAMGKPIAVEGTTVILGFDFPIFKEKFINTKHADELISEAFTSLLGMPCSVRPVTTSEYTVKVDKKEFHALAEELGGFVREE